MAIKLVAAIDLNGGLGKDNRLLTDKQKDDLKNFKSLTSNSPIVLGRKSHESILKYNKGKTLPTRTHLVLTRDYNYNPQQKNVVVYHSIDDIIHDYTGSKTTQDLYICGGSEVYAQFLPFVDELKLTIFHNVWRDADSFFPPIDINEWEVISNNPHSKDDDNEFDFNYVTYRRRKHNNNNI